MTEIAFVKMDIAVIRSDGGRFVGRPKKSETMDAISVRLSAAMTAEIDEYADAMRAEMPLLNVSRADAVRQLLANALKRWRDGPRPRSQKGTGSSSKGSLG